MPHSLSTDSFKMAERKLVGISHLSFDNVARNSSSNRFNFLYQRIEVT